MPNLNTKFLTTTDDSKYSPVAYVFASHFRLFLQAGRLLGSGTRVFKFLLLFSVMKVKCL
jgi:hypothetical protein